MGRKRMPGLYKRGSVWHIDKQVKGYGRLRESTETGDLDKATEFLNHRLDEIRHAKHFGIRPKRTFREAATKYLGENMHKRSIERDALDLRILDPFIGDLQIDRVHMGTLQGFINARIKEKVAVGTINRSLAIARRVLNLASRVWRDESGLTWLHVAPLIQLLPDVDKRDPYPLSWEEQRLLFSELPIHLADMALFKVNTGTREQEVVNLKWEWEIQIPELKTSVFVIPKEFVKNGADRLVVLNRVARSVVSAARGKHESRVFTFHGRPVTRMINSAWKKARKRAADRYEEHMGEPCPYGFRNIRVHDLKHTYGRRLRAAGVGFEDRQDLLGHRSGRVTTHYSAAELRALIAASEKACGKNPHKSPTLTLIRTRREAVSC